MSSIVQTVRGPVPAVELGIVLPHEHLFNDLSSCIAEPSYKFSQVLVDNAVGASLQWALKQDPYCCADNVAPKDVEPVSREVAAFQAIGGMTIVDATGSSHIGRSPERLHDLSEKTGLHVVMGTGAYLERFEAERITARTVEAMAEEMLSDIREGVDIGGRRIRAGIIGEVGVSPSFTEGERASLRASAIAQRESGTALNIHMPGWQRRGDEVLDIVVDEMAVNPSRVSLAHSDPSGADVDYQRRLLERGVWLEFDMIGLDITFPGEGVSPTVTQTADAVARLIDMGFADQILLSHDLFLKQMWSHLGGNGFVIVPTVFLELLQGRGIDEKTTRSLITNNPQRFLGGA